MFKFAFLGDIVGRPGREAARLATKRLRSEFEVEFIIANAENAAHGKGLTFNTANQLLQMGIDVLTSGNHIWAKRDIYDLFELDLPILRPSNYPKGTPGNGFLIISLESGLKIGIINVLGRVFMDPIDCPFRSVQQIISRPSFSDCITIVDVHAEATSEKMALAYYLDGRVAAVLGSHTHVPSADAKIFRKGCAYITDAGMCGVEDSILGVKSNIIVEKFLTSMPTRFELADGDRLVASGVIVECDEESKRAIRIDQFTWHFNK